MLKRNISTYFCSVLLSLLPLSTLAFEEGFTVPETHLKAPVLGNVYDIATKSKLLFKVAREAESKGSETTVRMTFTTPDTGEVAAIQEQIYQNGKLKKHILRRNQIHAECLVEIRNGRIYFQNRKDGKL